MKLRQRAVLFIAVSVSFLLLVGPPAVGSGSMDSPALQTGDIIFQTSASSQSYAIMWASKSLYSHVGILEIAADKKYVVEAISKVSRTPLEKWIARGRFGRYAVFRASQLKQEDRTRIIAAAKSYLGTGYDPYFISSNKEIYCSELVSLAFRAIGMELGKWQKVAELEVDNPVVRKLVERRWKKHPVCGKKIRTFEACWHKIMEEPLLTPTAISKDPKLELVFSNYPG